MYSHEELISAVSAAGRDGKTFTVKDVRTQLGFDSRDKKELSRFRRRLRAFEKAAADQLEKLGNNSYRLRPGAFEQMARAEAASAATKAPEAAPVSAEQPVEAVVTSGREVRLEPASGVFQSTAPANEPENEAQPVVEPAALPAVESPSAEAQRDGSTLHLVESPSEGADREPAERHIDDTPSAETDRHVPALHVVESPAAATPRLHVVEGPSAADERDAPRLHVVESNRDAPALHVVENPPASGGADAGNHAGNNAHAAYVATPRQPHEHNVSAPERVLRVASALVSGAFAASAAVSGRARQRSRNLREQLWSCVRSAPARKHVFARLRGWAESVRPLSNEVREHLSALRQRVLAGRRRAA